MKCNNKLCKTPDTTINVAPDPGYCNNCRYLSKNQGWFPNTVQPINTCWCDEPTVNEYCWSCYHDQECMDCYTHSI